VNGWESQGRITSSGKLLASEENGAGKAVVVGGVRPPGDVGCNCGRW